MAMDYCGVTRAGKPTFVLSSSTFAVGRKSIQKQGLTEQKRKTDGKVVQLPSVYQ
jgi:hypothetical protein